MKDEIFAFWPVDQKALLLGNLLIFRQELELLAKKTVFIDFVGQTPLPTYVGEVFTSEVMFTHIKSGSKKTRYDWPVEKERYFSEDYSSLKKIAYLSEVTGLKPHLKWPQQVKLEVQKILAGFNGKKIYACHLKRQPGGREESNADEQSWLEFFRSIDQNCIFMLLGEDLIPPKILGCPNVISAKNKKWCLSVQLALCQEVDGFIGMASGICCGAMFSKTPYVIFKHPAHHVEQMHVELGEGDSLPFAHVNQRILRKIDTSENLRKAFQQLAESSIYASKNSS